MTFNTTGLLRAAQRLTAGIIATIISASLISQARATEIVQVTAGQHFSCALDEAGQVWCWGRNQYGQLGDGTSEDSTVPVPVEGLANIVEISAGSEHACARRANGRVFCWGRNQYGQIGDDTVMVNRATPVQVEGLVGAEQISIGREHSCALRRNGTV